MNDISIISLLIDASIGVKLVLIVLLIMSVMSWGISIKKYFIIKEEQLKIIKFNNIFWKQKNIMLIYKQIHTGNYGFVGDTFKNSVKFFHNTKKDNPKIQGGLINEVISGNFQIAKQRKEKLLNEQIPILGTISSTSPYIGLLGTVYGILVAFWGLGMEGGASINEIAPSIAEALVATGMGLFVAIPALISYNYFTNKIETIGKDCADIVRSDRNIEYGHLIEIME